MKADAWIAHHPTKDTHDIACLLTIYYYRVITYSYFHAEGSQICKTQTSVVRTNCMDCLDRTNVVQSTIAKWVLTQQLRAIGVLSNKERIDEVLEFMHLFRNSEYQMLYKIGATSCISKAFVFGVCFCL